MFPKKQLTAAWLASVAVLFSTGLASPNASAMFSDDEARRAILDMRSKVESLSSRIAELERALQNAAQGQLQLLNENERMRAEIARLRGQVEETEGATRSGKSQQKDLYLDLEKRLKAQDTIIEGQRAELSALALQLKQLEPVTITVGNLDYRVSPKEKSEFEALQSALGAREFKQAVRLSLEFERNHSNSVLLPDVLFMKGTAHYADKDLKSSISARRDLISRFPMHPTIPQAMLNLAAGLAETGSPNTARRTLENLVKTYPKSPAAAEARKRLK